MEGPENNPLANIDTADPQTLASEGVNIEKRKEYLQGLIDSGEAFTKEERQRIQSHLEKLNQAA